MANPPFFGTKVSKPGVPVQKATDKQLVFKDTFSTKTWYDNSNSRIVEGLLPDGSYGMWVSKPGFDVTDPAAATNNNLIFNSNDTFFNIVGSGQTTVTVPNPPVSGTAYTTTIPHGLSFVPGMVVYINSSPTVTALNGLNGNIPTPWPVTISAATVFPATDATNLYIIVDSQTTSNFISGIWNFTYYLTRISSQ